MVMASNAADLNLANILTGIVVDEPKGQGTLASIILRKKGVTRGPATARTVYGDDFTHVLLWTGFDYRSLVERGFKRLHFLWSQGNLISGLYDAVQKAGYSAVTVQDVAEAIQDVDDSFLRILHGVDSRRPADSEDDAAPAPASPLWEPLRADGILVPGAKVYKGNGAPAPGKPKPGTVYIHGVKLGEKVLEPAPNGAWLPKQKPKTIAKDILKSWLPVGLYASYSLDPENLLTIKVGQAASDHAKAENVLVDPDAIRSLFKIAP